MHRAISDWARLEGIEWIEVREPGGTYHRWSLLYDQCTYPAALHGKAGEALQIPYLGTSPKALREELSLLERRSGTFCTDRFGNLSIDGGFIRIAGLPAGDYSLLLKRERQEITIRVTEATGEKMLGHILSGYRVLQQQDPSPLHISSMRVKDGRLLISVANADAFTRVHIAATRYLPAYRIFDDLGNLKPPAPGMALIPTRESYYQEGRDIGEEYRYILERQYAEKHISNMLKRPELLLNPWAINKTSTEIHEARKGTEWEPSTPPAESMRAEDEAEGGEVAQSDFANLDFLGEAAVVLQNLKPDKNGVVSIDMKALGAHSDIHVLAINPLSTVYRELSLSEKAMPPKDLRLILNLEPKGHFTEQKHISVAPRREELLRRGHHDRRHMRLRHAGESLFVILHHQ